MTQFYSSHVTDVNIDHEEAPSCANHVFLSLEKGFLLETHVFHFYSHSSQLKSKPIYLVETHNRQ